MHLLNTETLKLEEFIGKSIPPYAILSHVWGEDEFELSFEDLKHHDINTLDYKRAGYSKVKNTCKNAVADGLKYVWIDTCCVDHTSSAELFEVINYMFSFYRKSEVCYVYLADINITDGAQHESLDFGSSRWFSRGWTLQELLAPSVCKFFDSNWEFIGTRFHLSKTISEVTGIHPRYLRSEQDPREASCPSKMNWLSRRECTRAEDIAYCVSGLFDLNLPLLYGEGERTFQRLQKEILKQRKDTGVFSWYWDASVPDNWGSIFAPRPRLFDSSGLTPPVTFCKDDTRWITSFEKIARSSSEYAEWARAIGLTFDRKKHEDIPKQRRYIPTNEPVEADGILGEDSDASTDIASIFSDGGTSTSSASTTSLNPVQTIGIREVSRTLLSQDELKALYITAIRNVERRKARAHIRGFVKEYGINLLKEACNRSLDVQAAKFVRELAGRIANEIIWSITGYEGTTFPPEADQAKQDLEMWLSSLQTRSVDKVKTSNNDEISEGSDSDEELDDDLRFPKIDQVKEFLLNSEAFGTLFTDMRTWLKTGERPCWTIEGSAPMVSTGSPENQVEGPRVSSKIEDVPKETAMDSPLPRDNKQRAESTDNSATETRRESQNITRDTHPGSRPYEDRGTTADLIFSLLDYWGVSFYIYDLVELFVPRVRPGYKRLRWRCSCNTTLWGDFPADDDSALDPLKRELSRWSIPFKLSEISRSQPNQDLITNTPGAIHLGSMHFEGISTGNPGPGTDRADQPEPDKTATHTVKITFTPKYFEVCINIGNYAIDHHEIDISHVTSDNELFELIWDKYNSSRGGGLRRMFLRPKDVHFVMFSVGRQTEYGAGIHKKPDEFPPQDELDRKRYHYLCPKTRMPVNVFLHYLHRARWGIWGEHSEDTWLQRLPKKLKESILADMRQATPANQQSEEHEAIDPNLAFGWGVHILDGPNYAVLGLLPAIGVIIAFVVSGMIVGFAKTQEQGFGVGSFLLAIIANIMTAIYFQLQDR